jgi:hypothetical protein
MCLNHLHNHLAFSLSSNGGGTEHFKFSHLSTSTKIFMFDSVISFTDLSAGSINI